MASNGFLEAFGRLSLATRSATRSFPLKVTGYCLEGPVHYVEGHDLSVPDRPLVRVFLRKRRESTGSSSGASQRPEMCHFAIDPYRSFTESDWRNQRKVDAVAASVGAKCYTAPGGIVVVQSAYDDTGAGMISANWLSRVAIADDLVQQRAVILSSVMVSLSKPSPLPGTATNGRKPYFFADVLHHHKVVEVRSLADLKDALFTMLSMSAIAAAGRMLALIRLVESTNGHCSSLLLDRRAIKTQDIDGYELEAPDTTMGRLFASMSDQLLEWLERSLGDGSVLAYVVPGTRYRFRGNSLESLEKPPERRIAVNWERFQIPGTNGNADESGWMPCTIALLRHKGAAGDHPTGDEDFFPAGAWPMISDAEPVRLNDLTVIGC